VEPVSPARAARALLRSSLRGHGHELWLFIFWSAVEAVPAVLSGRLVAMALDRGFLVGDTGAGFGFLGLLGLSVLVGTWGTRQAFLKLAVVIEPFRDELVRRAVRGSLQRSAATGAPPDVAGVARLTQQVEIVREAYASVLIVAQGFLVTAVASFVGLLTLLPAAAPLVLAPLALGLTIFGLSLRRLAARQRESIMADEGIAGSVGIAVEGLRDVVAGGGEDIVERTVGRRIVHQARVTERLARMTALRTLAVAIGGWLPVVLILVAGSWLIRHGASTGAILGALTYVLRGVMPAMQQFVTGLGTTGLWLLVTLRRIVEATESAEPPASRLEAVTPAPVASGAELKLAGVTFAYGPGAEPVFEAVDLVVPDGDHLAVVGPSGVGKSTLANLIAGILAPQAGEVVLGGAPVDRMDPATLARQRVLIPQEAYVLPATLRENLLYLQPDASESELGEAIDRLGARALIERLGELDATVDPAALSAGESQLLTLVRAYLSPARLVLLDEATCHLDPGAEARAERAFAERPGSLIVVAHRISSALRARRVLVLDGDRIALGTHDTLLQSSPLYRDLVGSWDAGVPPVKRPRRPRRPLATALGRWLAGAVDGT
jgi:ABC-type multidrug transport system fused ATPase/permease subunit